MKGKGSGGGGFIAFALLALLMIFIYRGGQIPGLDKMGDMIKPRTEQLKSSILTIFGGGGKNPFSTKTLTRKAGRELLRNINKPNNNNIPNNDGKSMLVPDKSPRDENKENSLLSKFKDPNRPQTTPPPQENKDNTSKDNTGNKGPDKVDINMEMLNSLEVKEPDKVPYKRKEWKHWDTYDHDCWDTRKEALYRASNKDKIELRDKNKKITRDYHSACYVSKGEWVDPYSGKVFTNPSQLDLDHNPALGYTAAHGGQSWHKKLKEQYANDLDDVLIITSAKENRTKGAKGPADYMPPNKDYQCTYAIKTINVAKKYNLSITSKDKKALEKALKLCVK